jgi:hypothetical protein
MEPHGLLTEPAINAPMNRLGTLLGHHHGAAGGGRPHMMIDATFSGFLPGNKSNASIFTFVAIRHFMIRIKSVKHSSESFNQ